MRIASVIVSAIVCIISATGQELHAGDACSQPESSDAGTAGHVAMIQVQQSSLAARTNGQPNLQELPATKPKPLKQKPPEPLALKQDLHPMSDLDLHLTIAKSPKQKPLKQEPHNKSSQTKLALDLRQIGADRKSGTGETVQHLVKHRSTRVKKASGKKGRMKNDNVQMHVKSIGRGASKGKTTQKHSVETKDTSQMQSFLFGVSIVAPILLLVCGNPAGKSAEYQSRNQLLGSESEDKSDSYWGEGNIGATG